jgi:ribose 5-phosphate isomerase
MSESEDQLKMAAAESAIALVTDGMIVRLGSGSTYCMGLGLHDAASAILVVNARNCGELIDEQKQT